MSYPVISEAVLSGRYRFGFNGQEFEPQVSPGAYSAEFWMYESRLGRRWNVDPEYKHYLSNYSSLGNSPIQYLDPNGDDWYSSNGKDAVWTEGSKETISIEGVDYSNIGKSHTVISNFHEVSIIANYEQDQLKSLSVIEHSPIVIPSIDLGTDNNSQSFGVLNSSSGNSSNSNSKAITVAELAFQGTNIYYDKTTVGKYLSIGGYAYDGIKLLNTQVQIMNAEDGMAQATSLSEYQLHKQHYDNAIDKRLSSITSLVSGYFAPIITMTYEILGFMANETSLGRQQQAQLAYFEMQKWYNKPDKSTHQRRQYEYWKGQYKKYRAK